jgi:hypothetical protein
MWFSTESCWKNIKSSWEWYLPKPWLYLITSSIFLRYEKIIWWRTVGIFVSNGRMRSSNAQHHCRDRWDWNQAASILHKGPFMVSCYSEFWYVIEMSSICATPCNECFVNFNQNSHDAIHSITTLPDYKIRTYKFNMKGTVYGVW